MTPEDKAIINLEHDNEAKNITADSYTNGLCAYTFAGAITAMCIGIDGTDKLLNSMPPEFYCQYIHDELFGLINSGSEVHSFVREVWNEIVNVVFVSCVYGVVGGIAGKTLDVASRLRTGYYWKK
ncbi:MAG: hypothetical protein WC806_06270 [Candidatus Gracilibacteria bacterium]|jgi:hypothetical protein